jgi:hypothetical protein
MRRWLILTMKGRFFWYMVEQIVVDCCMLFTQLLFHVEESIIVDVFWVSTVFVFRTGIFVDFVVD